MNSTTPNPNNAGVEPRNRSTPDSMEQADRANGEGAEGSDVSDEDNDDPAATGVQDGD